MSVIIGSIIGAVVTLAMTIGLFFLSTIVRPLAICNCGCCLWPLVGGIVGAALAIKMSGSGGAGKGTAVGILSGLIYGGGLCLISFLGTGFIFSQLTSAEVWPKIWHNVNDKQIDEMNFNVRNARLEQEIKGFMKTLKGHKSFQESFTAFQKWLTDERIELILTNSKPEEKDKIRKTLKEFRSSSYDEAVQKSKPFIDDLKVKAVVQGIFIAVLFCGFLGLMGLFGGLIGGAIFATEEGGEPKAGAAPTPPPMPAA